MEINNWDNQEPEIGEGQTPNPEGDRSPSLSEDVLLPVVERVLSRELGTLRQDLATELERRVQSMTDKAEYRLSQRQQQELSALDRVLGRLKEQLGPEYDQIRNQSRMEILLDQQTAGQNPQAEQPQPQPQAQQSEGDRSAEAYLSSQLGDPQNWTQEQRDQIAQELNQARGNFWNWIQTVNKWAAMKPQAARQQPTASSPGGNGNTPNPASDARIQPLGTGGGVRQSTMQQLNVQLNQAYSEGEYEKAAQIAQQMDELMNRK